MKSVSLKFIIVFLMCCFTCQGYADDGCPWNVKGNTELEITANKAGKGIAGFFSGIGDLFRGKVEFDVDFDPKKLQYISAHIIRDKGVEGYFNPRIKVCDYEGGNCYELYNGTSCRQIYGTQSSGAGVSAAVFIDWEGDKVAIGSTLAGGLEWEWAKDVTAEEKEKFAKSPKICACSQKGACMSGVNAWGAKVFAGDYIFYPGEMDKICDTCSTWQNGRQKIKCAPIPLAPGPPPFCDQLKSSPPQVKIVPVSANDNDYFDPKVRVIITGLKEVKSLDFPKEISDKENRTDLPHHIKHKNTTYYFKTYREKSKLCAEYYGTQEINDKNLQFTRCFPVPSVPQPEIVNVEGNNTLKVKMRMSSKICRDYGTYSNGICIFNIYDNRKTNIGPFSLKVIKPAMTQKGQDNIDAALDKILSNETRFKTLRDYGCVPRIEVGCEDKVPGANNKCKLDDLGYPKIKVSYQENKETDKGNNMLCISGYQPKPEEFVLARPGELIRLKLMDTGYTKYVPVYSEESKSLYYLARDETFDLLAQPQDKLDEIVFDKKEYITLPRDPNNEGKELCIVKTDSDIDGKRNSHNCKVVYKLIDSEYKGHCQPKDDGCVVINGVYTRSTKYVKKDTGEPFYLKVSQKSNGDIKPEEKPIRANKTEVFYADKLCTFNLKGLTYDLNRVVMAHLQGIKTKQEDQYKKRFDLAGSGNYTDDLSKYEYVEIEAWGGGEAGHISGQARSKENRIGMPGDYIRAKLKVDSNYPYLKATVTEGGGNVTQSITNKDGGPTIIEMCSSNSGGKCKPLVTAAGGGRFKQYGQGMQRIETKVHRDLQPGETQNIKVASPEMRKNKQAAYIVYNMISNTSEIRYETVNRCSDDFKSNMYGAGGCVDKSRGIYSKGSPGHVIIRPMGNEINKDEISKAINDLLEDKNKGININDETIKSLDPTIAEMIKDKVAEKLACTK
ncbi:hypothetical protein IC220_05610 [Wolbachia endosymbiont of Pentalonia nigronervosa]|uniref:hypothetical protein n=1 Tax=Wolbachia endosymbiont of Pentalonia nigronervosa TaxID=1301914 RepID=UPI00165F28D3|nr:hypothetical protein [Wolbachia endosymbiont of Pentalonia nigronervosa]MBD0391907.1 hypothetical protein [Wolbachia endosymbiont of Pentalonia nigronervosa]